MKLISAIQLGKECGLQTVEECVLNVEHQSLSLFIYDKLGDELVELEFDVEKYAKLFNISFDEVLSWTIKEFELYRDK